MVFRNSIGKDERFHADNAASYGVVLSLSQADSVLQTAFQELQASKHDLTLLYNKSTSVLTPRPWTMFTFTPRQGVTTQVIDVDNHCILIVGDYLSAQFYRWSYYAKSATRSLHLVEEPYVILPICTLPS